MIEVCMSKNDSFNTLILLFQKRHHRFNISNIYQTQRNMAAVDWERNRRNWLEAANMNGINTGANSQYRLSMMGQSAKTQNALGGQQAAAEVAADRNIADIKRSTQASINEAVANNDYKKAAALLDEYNQAYSRAADKAQALAQYGDFSGYATLYGDDVATQMAYNWYAQDPNLAFMMGAITEGQRDNLLQNRPINEGLDADGNRVEPVKGGGGGGGGSTRSLSDIMRGQLGEMKANVERYNSNPANVADGTAAAYEAHYNAVNSRTSTNF